MLHYYLEKGDINHLVYQRVTNSLFFQQPSNILRLAMLRRVPLPFLLPSFIAPLQISPLPQSISHSPQAFSCLNSPLKLKPLSFFNVPLPSLIPFQKCPSQMVPSAQQQVPIPCDKPSTYSPQYLSPFGKDSLPKPCLRKFLNEPQYFWPVVDLCTPSPSTIPFFHSPMQLSPLGDVHMPTPCLFPSLHSPEQNSPLGHLNSPFPSFLSFLNKPLYSPCSVIYTPFHLHPFFHVPSYTQPLFISIPIPSRFYEEISPKQSESSPYQIVNCGLLMSSIILTSEFLGTYFLMKLGNSPLDGILVSIFCTVGLMKVF